MAQSVVLLAATWVQLRLAFGKRTRGAITSMLATTLRAAAVMALAFAPGLAIALASDQSAAGTAGAVAISLPLAFVATRLAWPAELRTVLSLTARPLRGPDQPQLLATVLPNARIARTGQHGAPAGPRRSRSWGTLGFLGTACFAGGLLAVPLR